MLRTFVSTCIPSISFPVYSEENLENRRYNLAQHFGVWFPDDGLVSRLLFHSSMLYKDLKEAAKKEKEAQMANKSRPVMRSNPGRSAGAPMRWRRR